MADDPVMRLPLDPEEDVSADAGKSFEKLRHLILAPEQEDLARLRERRRESGAARERSQRGVARSDPVAPTAGRRGGSRCGPRADGRIGAPRIRSQGSHYSRGRPVSRDGPRHPAFDPANSPSGPGIIQRSDGAKPLAARAAVALRSIAHWTTVFRNRARAQPGLSRRAGLPHSQKHGPPALPRGRAVRCD